MWSEVLVGTQLWRENVYVVGGVRISWPAEMKRSIMYRGGVEFMG